MRRQTSTPSNINMARRRQPSVAIFQIIVALELAFLVFMWMDPLLFWAHSFTQTTSIKVHNIYAQSSRESDLYYKDYTPTTPTLLIGGTDGSGTRAIAKTMKSLGVVMKLDDPHTLDVHAPVRSKGWTQLVQRVLQETHSAHYHLEDLSNTTKARLISLLRHSFWKSVKQFRLTKRQPLNSTGVFVGLKAPAMMLLLPLIQQAIGPIQFIHVVRDGRDIALSRNQSPVANFYSYMYPNDTSAFMNATNNIPVMAMRLWKDWNIQVLKWEQAHHASNKSDFRYLVVRTEDLLHSETRLETLVRLATFVNSPMSMKGLCHMSQLDAMDLGQSVDWQGKSTQHEDVRPEHHLSLDERYGKWKQILRDKPELATMLHNVGAEGLAAFGYQPPAERWLSLGSRPSSALLDGSDNRLDCHNQQSKMT